MDIFENSMINLDDQEALHMALWQMSQQRNPEFRIHALPQEYNFRFNIPCMRGAEVRILHGRPSEDSTYLDVARVVNNPDRRFMAWPTGVVT